MHLVLQPMRNSTSPAWLLDDLAEGVVLVGPGWRVELLNHAAETLLNVRREEVLYTSFGTAPLELSSADLALCREVVEDGRPRTLHGIRFGRQDDRVLSADVRPSPRGGILVRVRDVTEQTRTKEAYTRAEEEVRLRDRAIAAASNAISICSAEHPQHPLIYVNPAMERMTGYAADEMIGRSAWFLHGPETDPSSLQEIQGAIREGRSCTVTLLSYRKDGTAFWTEASVSPVRDAEGRMTHCVAIMTDITERMRAEAEREAEREAAAAERSRFYATMSHELRTPIQAVLLAHELLLSEVYGPLSEAQRDGIELAQRSVQHLAELVSDALDLTKLEAGKTAIEAEVFSVVDLVEGLFASLRPLARKHGCTLKLAGERNSLFMVTDPRRLRQILLNLLSNAIKFGEGKPIHVSLARRSDSTVVVEVVDRGPGIEAKDLGRIFEEFAQLRGTRHEGTGLGLPISKRIATLLGGRLEVESTPGVGSTFRLVLPEYPTQA
jgi:PAS domain S-box-containing protein